MLLLFLLNVHSKPNLDYHTSAILASLIDSVTSVWRQKSQHTSMNEVVDGLDVYKYNVNQSITNFNNLLFINKIYNLLDCELTS